MTIADWFAKNVAGPSGYGQAIAREMVTGGLALGRYLYVGHGARVQTSQIFVYPGADEMVAAGFTMYCHDALNTPPWQDSSPLSRHCRAAGVAFAASCAFNAASNFMTRKNTGAFTRSLGAGVRTALAEQSPDVGSGLVLYYARLPRPGMGKIVNLENPAENDLLGVFLGEVVDQSADGKGIGFRKHGVLGFDIVALTLAEETVKAINAAVQKFQW